MINRKSAGVHQQEHQHPEGHRERADIEVDGAPADLVGEPGPAHRGEDADRRRDAQRGQRLGFAGQLLGLQNKLLFVKSRRCVHPTAGACKCRHTRSRRPGWVVRRSASGTSTSTRRSPRALISAFPMRSGAGLNRGVRRRRHRPGDVVASRLCRTTTCGSIQRPRSAALSSLASARGPAALPDTETVLLDEAARSHCHCATGS